METFIHKYNIDETLCDELIHYHKTHDEYKIEGCFGNDEINKEVKDSIDVMYFNPSNNSTIIKYFETLSFGVKEYVKKYKLIGRYRTNLTNLIQYYPPGGGFKTWHNERAEWGVPDNIISFRGLVYMTYLNTVNKGGETEFLHQKIKIKPKKGLTLIWPTDFTHEHRGIVAPKEEKYITTGWFNLV